jgi:hypothetical protein
MAALTLEFSDNIDADALLGNLCHHDPETRAYLEATGVDVDALEAGQRIKSVILGDAVARRVLAQLNEAASRDSDDEDDSQMASLVAFADDK